MGLDLAAHVGAWTNATLANSWVAYGGGVDAPRFRLENGGRTVRLGGFAKDGTMTATTVIFTLPVGYRPASIRDASVRFGDTLGFGRIVIASTGAVSIGTDFTDNNFLSFDGVTFDLD